MIDRISTSEVLAGCRRTLGIPGDHETGLDEAMLAALTRRSAGVNCPCSRATLRASLVECTRGLPANYDSLPDAVDDAIEALIVGGDLLELNDVVTEDSDIAQTWVFAAPPGFVIRPSGSAFLFGIVPDQDTFLPSPLASRVVQRGFTRFLEPRSDEDLPRQLKELGLQQLSDSAWLRSPRPQNPAEMINSYKRLLADQPPVTAIRDLRILDSSRPVTYYRGRWIDPTDHEGSFVARRPQEFGAPIWCLVDLRNGDPVRLLDLPLARTRWRGCDSAWHLQMGIDHDRGTPQVYRRRDDRDTVRFDFFSPLPQWSQRRLMILGMPVPRDRCLFSYVLPADEADAEEAFLQESLWLSRSDHPR